MKALKAATFKWPDKVISLASALASIGLISSIPLSSSAYEKNTNINNSNSHELLSIATRLKTSEGQYSDIVEGAEKSIHWHHGVAQRTPISIVYLHGFSATHKELSPMTEKFAEKLGANVYYARLTGHGRTGDAMSEATVNAWKKDTSEAYRIGAKIGERVLLIGTSTGGTLSTWLSAQPLADKLLANILISPNFAVKSSGTWLLKNSVGLWFAKKISGEYRSFEPLNEFHAQYWTERYPIEALVPMLKLLDEVDDLDKSTITAPQLLVYSPDDKVVDIDKALKTMKEFTSAKVSTKAFVTSTDPSQHVLVGYGSSSAGRSNEDQVQEQVDNMLEFLLPYVEGLTHN